MISKAAICILLSIIPFSTFAAQRPAPAAAAAPIELALTTSDGWALLARYRRAGKGKAVVLLHGLAAGKGEWLPLEEALARRGVSTLALDLRGHDPASPERWKTFSDHGPNGQWASMWKDAEAGYRALRERGHRHIGIGGASLGANVALESAARLPAVRFAALLSPGIDYQGVRADTALARFGARPLLLAASPGDDYADRSVSALQKLRDGRSPALRIEAPAGHGAQMLRDPEVLERIADWIANR